MNQQSQENSNGGKAESSYFWHGDDFWAGDWMFGHEDGHHFVETVKLRAPKEIGCAFAASLLVSPLVSIIDKCIVQDISGSAQFMNAIGKASKEMVM